MSQRASAMLILELPEPLLGRLADRYASQAQLHGIHVLPLPLQHNARESFDRIRSRVDSEPSISAIIHVALGWRLQDSIQMPALVSPRDHLALWDCAEYTTRDAQGAVTFLDISQPYDAQLLQTAEHAAREKGLDWASVVVACHPCPWFLSPSERDILTREGCQTVTRLVPLTAKMARTRSIPVLGVFALLNQRQDATFFDIEESMLTFLDRILLSRLAPAGAWAMPSTSDACSVNDTPILD